MRRVATFGMALLVAVALVPIQSAPAQQQPTVLLTPNSGPPGTTVSLDGSGFTGSSPVVVFFNQVGGQVLEDGNTDNLGTFKVQFPIPSSAPGSYPVIVCISYNPSAPMPCREQASANLRILATATTTAPPQPTTTLPLGTGTTSPESTTTSSLHLQSVTTSTLPDPPAPSGPVGVAFTTTSTSLPTPGGFQGQSTPHPDLEVTAVEVTQGIQDLQNRMPLVANRPTLVRVYVAVDRSEGIGLGGLVGTTPDEPSGVAELSPVEGLLHLQRDGQSIIVYPDNGPITAHNDGGDRTELWDTLNFTLPPDWTIGEVNMTAFVWSDHPHLALYADPEPGNNFAQGTVVFHQSQNPLVIVLRLNPVSTHALSDSGFTTAVSTATKSYQRYHPLDTPNFAVIPQPLGPGPSTNEDDPTDEWDMEESVGQPLRRMKWLFLEWGLGEEVRMHGLIRSSTPTGKWSGFASGKVAWSKPTELTPGHEAGHQYGLKHVPCKDEDDDGQPDELEGGAIDQTHPSGLPSCSIAPESETGYYGTDLWLLVPPEIYSNDPAHPSVVYPFMGYLAPRFVDAYHYCVLMGTYGIPCNPAAIGLPPKAKPGPPVNCGPSQGNGITLDLCLVIETDDDDLFGPIGPPGSVLLVVPETEFEKWVMVEVDAGTSQFGHAQLVDDTPTLRHELTHTVQQAKTGELGNQVMLRVTDVGGHVLAMVPATGTGHGSDADEVPAPYVGVEVVPWPANAAALDLLVDGVVVDTLSPSASPTVTIGPIEVNDRVVDLSWAGEDPDGDALAYSLYWSTDGGVSWRVVEFGITGTEWSLAADALQLPGGEVHLKVTASDGFATGSAVSGPVSVSSGGPTGSIAGPDTIPQYLHSTLTVHVYDPEDGPIETGVWRSDLDGDLGQSRTISTRDLSLGAHVISATVSDSDGTQATFVHHLLVEESDIPAPKQPGSAPEAEIIVAIGPGNLDQYQFPAPAGVSVTTQPAEVIDTGTPTFVLWLALGGLVVLAVGLLWRRARDSRE